MGVSKGSVTHPFTVLSCMAVVFLICHVIKFRYAGRSNEKTKQIYHSVCISSLICFWVIITEELMPTNQTFVIIVNAYRVSDFLVLDPQEFDYSFYNHQFIVLVTN